MSAHMRFEYDVLLEFDRPVRSHSFVLRCLPSDFPGQRIPDLMPVLDPSVPCSLQRDGFGNLLLCSRIEGPHDRFRYRVEGTAVVDPAARVREEAMAVFRYATPLTAVSSEMKDFAGRLALPAAPAEKADALCGAVYDRLRYLSGSTDVSASAADVFAGGEGVCQDFAHLYLALARHCGLTARYVNGLLLGEGATHAWCEVLLDGIWTGIDPTHRCRSDDRYIRFNTGRDFRDCPMERGVFSGNANQHQTVSAKVCGIR